MCIYQQRGKRQQHRRMTPKLGPIVDANPGKKLEQQDSASLCWSEDVGESSASAASSPALAYECSEGFKKEVVLFEQVWTTDREPSRQCSFCCMVCPNSQQTDYIRLEILSCVQMFNFTISLYGLFVKFCNCLKDFGFLLGVRYSSSIFQPTTLSLQVEKSCCFAGLCRQWEVYNLATHCTWRVTSISIPSSAKLNNSCFTPILLLKIFIFFF